MNILILGGTRFLGRAVSTHLLGAGHRVTCLARGSADPVDGVTFHRADRTEPGAYDAVAGATWDVVVDLTSRPQQAREAVDALAAERWVFVSSTSVYLDQNDPVKPEDSALFPPLNLAAEVDGSVYPQAKVACEQIYRERPGTLIIRPGLIGGYGDITSRSGYYPWRWAHPTGEDVIIPDPTYPVALIDVDDLGAFIAHAIHRSLSGIFNVNGETTTLGELAETCQALTPHPVPARVISDEQMEKYGIRPWYGPRSLPLYIPGKEERHSLLATSDAALAEGLTRRPLQDTLRAALDFELQRSDARPAGLTDDEERELRVLISE